MLATSAVKGRAAALDHPSYSSAAAASLAFPVIDRKALGEIAEFAIGRGKVAKTGPARRDRFCKNVVNGGNESPQPRRRNAASGALGTDAGPVKSLAHVDIAKPGDDMLVEEQQLDRRRSAFEPASKFRRVEVERLGTQGLDRRPFVKLAGRHEVERAEPARIVERKPVPIVGFEDQMVVLLDHCWIDPPPSRHAEVKDERVAAVGVDQPIFGAASQPRDAGPGQALAEILGKRAPEVRAAGFDALDPTALEHARQTANRRFNFR